MSKLLFLTFILSWWSPDPIFLRECVDVALKNRDICREEVCIEQIDDCFEQERGSCFLEVLECRESCDFLAGQRLQDCFQMYN